MDWAVDVVAGPRLALAAPEGLPWFPASQMRHSLISNVECALPLRARIPITRRQSEFSFSFSPSLPVIFEQSGLPSGIFQKLFCSLQRPPVPLVEILVWRVCVRLAGGSDVERGAESRAEGPAAPGTRADTGQVCGAALSSDLSPPGGGGGALQQQDVIRAKGATTPIASERSRQFLEWLFLFSNYQPITCVHYIVTL